MEWLNPGRWLLYAAFVALVLGAWRLEEHIEAKGYARAVAEAAAAAAQQAQQNRELARRAELRYTVAAEQRERVIVQTVKEIQHETVNLAVCSLSAGAVGLLNHAAQCARDDTAATCGAGEQVRNP